MIGTPRAERILELLNVSFTKTADIEISKNCYFTTNGDLEGKQNFNPYVEKNDIINPNNVK